jgi:Phytanoyl-CoA dioxygenase (PhyH)
MRGAEALRDGLSRWEANRPVLTDARAADTTDREAQRNAFRVRGYVVLRGVLSPAEVNTHTRTLEHLSGVSRASLASVETAIQRARGVHRAWTRPDGLSQHPPLWDLIFHPRLVESARGVLGRDIRYLPHSDLHAGFSAVAWHRDSVDPTCGEGPDWNETREPYRLARVVLYLQTFAESRFSLGLIAGTHRGALAVSRRGAIGREVRRMSAERTAGVTPSALCDRADWISAQSGDAILFDPRLIHSGSPLSGPKYSVSLGYGAPGGHFRRHATHHRRSAGEGVYRDLPAPLVARLRGEGLHASESIHIAEARSADSPVAG